MKSFDCLGSKQSPKSLTSKDSTILSSKFDCFNIFVGRCCCCCCCCCCEGIEQPFVFFSYFSFTSSYQLEEYKRNGTIWFSNQPWIPLIYCSGLLLLKVLLQVVMMSLLHLPCWLWYYWERLMVMGLLMVVVEAVKGN